MSRTLGNANGPAVRYQVEDEQPSVVADCPRRIPGHGRHLLGGDVTFAAHDDEIVRGIDSAIFVRSEDGQQIPAGHDVGDSAFGRGEQRRREVGQ